MNTTRLPHQPPDVSIAPRLITVSSIFYTLALSLFATRFYVRFRDRKLGKDDLALSAGMISGTALFITQFILVAHGTGRHIIYLSWPDLQAQFLLNIVISQFYIWAMTMVKMSLSFMWLRFQDGRVWRIGLYALIFPQLGMAITEVLLDLFRCHPIRAAWDLSIPRSQCHPVLTYRTSIMVSSGVSMFTDIIYTFIPVIIIGRIHRPLRERLVICFLMALGLLATAATLPKLVGVVKFGFKVDLTYRSSDALLWSTLEVNIGIIAACVPTLRRPFESALRRCGWVNSSQMGPDLESLEFTRAGSEKDFVEASWLKIEASSGSMIAGR